MENQFTKGPWVYVGGDNNSIDIVLPDDTTISIDRQSRYTGEYVISREQMEANALLISKAPEMLEMLIKCYDEFTKQAEKGMYPEGFMQENGGKGLSEISELIKSATTL